MRSTFDTWWAKNDLVSWTFILPARGASDAFEGIRARAMEVLSLLDGFARLEQLSLTTEEHGDNAIVVAEPNTKDPAMVQDALFTSERVVQVLMSLDLLVSLDADGVDTWLRRMAHVWLDFDESLPENGSIMFDLSLDVDIYSPVTWGDSRDNRELARRNGPRLTAFLRSIQEKLGGVLFDIDASYSCGQVDENGFKPAA